jgi:hypothetical protein
MEDILEEIEGLCTYIDNLPFDKETIKDELSTIEGVAKMHEELEKVSSDYQEKLYQVFTL